MAEARFAGCSGWFQRLVSDASFADIPQGVSNWRRCMNDALQKNQFSGELLCLKVISSGPRQYHRPIQQRMNMATK
jgi:hypothetical protein